MRSPARRRRPPPRPPAPAAPRSPGTAPAAGTPDRRLHRRRPARRADRALGAISGDGRPLSLSLQILLLMSLLTVLPSILLMMTSFTRIIIVLSILRQAIGLQQTPPNQVLVGLSLFLSLFVMAPVIDQINAQRLHALWRRPDQRRARLITPLRRRAPRLHDQADARDRPRRCSPSMAKAPAFARPDDVPFSILLPAFVTSELKTAFQIGFLIFLPFLVIDLVVAIDADVAGHDDAVADDHLDAVQAAAVRAGRRLGADHGLARRLVRGSYEMDGTDYFVGVAQQALWILALACGADPDPGADRRPDRSAWSRPRPRSTSRP